MCGSKCAPKKREYLGQFMQNSYEVELTLNAYHNIRDVLDTNSVINKALYETLDDLREISKTVISPLQEVDLEDGETMVESIDDKIEQLKYLKFQVTDSWKTRPQYYVCVEEGNITRWIPKKDNTQDYLFQTLFKQHLIDEDKTSAENNYWRKPFYFLWNFIGNMR